MANSSTPFGFLPFGHRDGSAPTMGLEQVNINSSNTFAFFTGDLVIRSTAGNNTITQSVAGSTSAQVPAGVFAGCEFFSAAAGRVVWSRFFPGSVGANATVGVTKAWIVSDPEMQFLGASGSSVPFTATEVGFNAVIVTSQSSLGNTISGQSAMILSTAVTANASAAWKIVDLYSNVLPGGVAPGSDPTTGFNWVVLTPNSWERRTGTTGIST